MRAIQQSAILLNRNMLTSPTRHIENIGRICYKSEDKICEGSNIKFCNMLAKNNHMAMLEHYRFLIRVPSDALSNNEINLGKYIERTPHMISGSARAFMDVYKHTDSACTYEFINAVIRRIICTYHDSECLFPGYEHDFALVCRPSYCSMYCVNANDVSLSPEEILTHGWFSVKFITDRGVSHELVRHRPILYTECQASYEQECLASYAQESTRYCNYGSMDMQFIPPLNLIDTDSKAYSMWANNCIMSEITYKRMLEMGFAPQEARDILPMCLKTEIVVTATNMQWVHMFNLRMFGTTGKPHPKIKQLFQLLWQDMFKTTDYDGSITIGDKLVKNHFEG